MWLGAPLWNKHTKRAPQALGEEKDSTRLFHKNGTEENSNKQSNQHMVGDPTWRMSQEDRPRWASLDSDFRSHSASTILQCREAGLHRLHLWALVSCGFQSHSIKYRREERDRAVPPPFFPQGRGDRELCLRASITSPADYARPSMRPSLPRSSKHSSLLLQGAEYLFTPCKDVSL